MIFDFETSGRMFDFSWKRTFFSDCRISYIFIYFYFYYNHIFIFFTQDGCIGWGPGQVTYPLMCLSPSSCKRIPKAVQRLPLGWWGKYTGTRVGKAQSFICWSYVLCICGFRAFFSFNLSSSQPPSPPLPPIKSTCRGVFPQNMKYDWTAFKSTINFWWRVKTTNRIQICFECTFNV